MDSYLFVGAELPNAVSHANYPSEGDGGVSSPVGRSGPPAT